MKQHMSLVFTVCTITACSAPEPTPDPRPAPVPEEQRIEVEPEPEEAVSYIDYSFKDGRTRAYLAFTSPICQEDEDAQPIYEIQALWKYDTTKRAWKSLEVAPDVPYRLACNAMLDLVNVLGYDLDPATYAVEAEIGGVTERDILYVGDLSCDEMSLGPAPEGQMALCVVGPNSAEAKFVPDPTALD